MKYKKDRQNNLDIKHKSQTYSNLLVVDCLSIEVLLMIVKIAEFFHFWGIQLFQSCQHI